MVAAVGLSQDSSESRSCKYMIDPFKFSGRLSGRYLHLTDVKLQATYMISHTFSCSSYSENFSNKERDIMFFAIGPRRFSVLYIDKWK